MLSKVVLPDPEPPTIAKILPAGMSNETESNKLRFCWDGDGDCDCS